MQRIIDSLLEWADRLSTAKLPQRSVNVLMILVLADLVLVSYVSAQLADVFA